MCLEREAEHEDIDKDEFETLIQDKAFVAVSDPDATALNIHNEKQGRVFGIS